MGLLVINVTVGAWDLKNNLRLFKDEQFLLLYLQGWKVYAPHLVSVNHNFDYFILS